MEDAHQEEHGDHAALYWIMGWPLIILATITVLLGFFETPLRDFLLGHYATAAVHEGSHHGWVLYVSIALGLSGIGLTWLEFGRRGSAQIGFVERIPPLYRLFAERWYIDRFYRLFLDYVIYGIVSNLFTRNDRRVIDGGIDGVCKATVGSGWMLSFLQSGMLQYNLMVMFAVLGLVALYFFF